MKKFSVIILTLSIIVTVFASCGSGTSDKGNTTTADNNTSDTTEANYEYTFRELPEPVYHEAAENFAGGTGSKDDPYQISDSAELAFMESVINDPDKPLNNEYDNAFYILTDDISLNDTSDYENWAETAPKYSWNPINELMFKGVFDGNGHTISGLYINTNAENSNESYGLFGQMNGTVKNLTVDKSYISVSGNSADVGSIAGRLMENGKIINCISNTDFDSYDGSYGGIAGSSSGDISHCNFKGTITQKKADTFSDLGGIVGEGGSVSDCTNKGNIYGGDTAGGISGRQCNEIQNCVNEGTISGAECAGGITGKIYIVGTDLELETTEGKLSNCINKGKVSGEAYSGGIAGSVSNDESDFNLIFSDCVNNGEITGSDSAGIISHLSAERNGSITIKNCINNSDITGKIRSSGIVCLLMGVALHMEGDINIINCENRGNVTSKDMYSAGILTYFMLMGSELDIRLTVQNCSNSGKIESQNYSGGIFGFTSSSVAGLSDISSETAITVDSCENNGEIITHSDNSYIGGIAANWGAKNIPSVITNCKNTGTLSYLNGKPNEETLKDEKVMTLSRIAGGIIGRIGEGTFLTTDNDTPNADNINKQDALITIKDCSSTGELAVNDKTEYTNENGEQLYENYFGGIIGNTSGEDALSVLVEDCTYTNFDRGLGNETLPDVGEK